MEEDYFVEYDAKNSSKSKYFYLKKGRNADT
jgi:hypothetical protein